MKLQRIETWNVKKMLELSEFKQKCSIIITLLNSFIDDPSPKNDRKAWKGFKEFIDLLKQVSSENEIVKDNYDELIGFRHTIARLRAQRDEHRSAGRDELADKAEAVIQRNYQDSMGTIKEIQLSLDQPQIKGAIESLGYDRIKNKQLRNVLSKYFSQLKLVRGGRILWIDDKPHNIVGERRLLRALGAEVITAVTSESAEEILNRDNDFDIIITDVQRLGESYKLNNGEPIHEGVNFIVKLRKFEDPIIKSIPVIFYAAYDWKRLVAFTEPAREISPVPTISNSIEDMLAMVITVLSEVRLKPIKVNREKKPTSPDYARDHARALMGKTHTHTEQ